MARDLEPTASNGRYSTAEIERGLQAIAICNGSVRRARRELAERGFNVPRTTLETWKHHHAERYQKIQAEIVPQVHARMAQESAALADYYGALERQAADLMAERIEQMKAGELPGALRNFATARGISTDKALVLGGQPNQILEHRNPDELIRKLQAAGILGTVDSTAEEI